MGRGLGGGVEQKEKKRELWTWTSVVIAGDGGVEGEEGMEG